jgi:predicted DNA-binding protein YlxM (UPF0122 family)
MGFVLSPSAILQRVTRSNPSPIPHFAPGASSMARKKTGASISSYFRDLFTAHPELLAEKSNEAIVSHYRKDHDLADDAELEATVRNNMANMKSVMRKKLREAPLGVSNRKPGGRLETLEELIDECLTIAKTIDRDGLESVINHLRRARNEVVWKLGQS